MYIFFATQCDRKFTLTFYNETKKDTTMYCNKWTEIVLKLFTVIDSN